MGRWWRELLLTVVLVAGALVGLTGIAQASTCPTVYWGSLPKVATLSPGAAITAVRTGIQPCYDRVVLDVPGSSPSGWNVSYGTPAAEGSGFPLTVPGGAKLDVGLAHPSSLGTVNQSLANVAGYPVLRSVVYGGSFEGYTTIGVGVRARLPFRVFALTGPARIVIDIARSWS